MIYYNIKLRSITRSAVLLIVVLALFAGCGDTLKNDVRANLPPTVEFVNIPPENQSFSQNPEINWIGKDVDGQVVLFRFAVIEENDIIAAIGGTSPLSNTEVQNFVTTVLTTMNDTVWTNLVVDQQSGDPQTSNIIPMNAELSDPVNTFVAQFVFIQAFDEEGLASSIAFRRFLRNDNPPNTFIRAFAQDRDFINAVVSTSFATGVRIRWEGVDPIDFPTDAPPFEFHWRLYGPYLSDTNTITSGYLEDLFANYVKPVFVTSDAKIFEFGKGLSFLQCREIVDVVNGGLKDSCETVFIDTIQASSPIGTIDTLFDTNDTGFINNPSLNRITAESFDGIDEWTFDRRDSLFNMFREEQSASTITRHFVFWVRSRDDANVPDLTPAFVPFRVVDPKFERDLLVVNAMTAFDINGVFVDSARKYWHDVIIKFGRTDYQDSIIVPSDTALDYLTISGPSGNVLPLESMLAHKAVIIYGDDTKVGLLGPVFPKVGTAINAGVNMWLASRNPIAGGEGASPQDPVLTLPPEYRLFFGVQQAYYSGWDWHIRVRQPAFRIEDFVGTFTLNEKIWPPLKIDTLRLRTNYNWSTFPLTYVDTLGPDKNQSALPEVNWFVRIPGTEPMYLYKSIFGSSHPLGSSLSFDGHPVMIRFNTGLFRTVHSLFTPIAFEQDSMQVLIDSTLSWLLTGKLNSSSPGSVTYDDAPNPAAAQSALKEYWRVREMEEEFLPPITYGIGKD